MKKMICLLMLFSIFTSLASCSNKIEYTEKLIKDSYVWNGYEIVTIDVSYPELDARQYPSLSNAIFSEFYSVDDEYDALRKDRQDMCEKDPICAMLQCYITATYEVERRGKMIYVTLVRDCFAGGAASHGYTKTIEYNTKTDEWREIKSDIH